MKIKKKKIKKKKKLNKLKKDKKRKKRRNGGGGDNTWYCIKRKALPFRLFWIGDLFGAQNVTLRATLETCNLHH